MPTASARPPSVMILIVWPMKLSTITEVRIDSGIDTAMISVERQLPRNSRIIMAVSPAAMTASRMTPTTARLDENRLVGESLDPQLRRQRLFHPRQHGANAVDDADRRGIAGFDDAKQHAATAILAHDVGLRRKSDADGRDVAEIDGRIADGLDRHVVQLIGCLRRAIDMNIILELPRFSPCLTAARDTASRPHPVRRRATGPWPEAVAD